MTTFAYILSDISGTTSQNNNAYYALLFLAKVVLPVNDDEYELIIKKCIQKGKR